jgi:hypothetical protein
MPSEKTYDIVSNAVKEAYSQGCGVLGIMQAVVDELKYLEEPKHNLVIDYTIHEKKW